MEVRLGNSSTMAASIALTNTAGVSGSLRPIPVSPTHAPPTPATSGTKLLSTRPRVSQTLLQLLKSSALLNNDTTELDTAGKRSTPDFVSADAKERQEALQAASAKKESIYEVSSHYHQNIRFPAVPITPESLSSKFHRSSSNAQAVQVRKRDISESPSKSDLSTVLSHDKPTYARVAASVTSPDVIEKRIGVETLFTPVRNASHKAISHQMSTTVQESPAGLLADKYVKELPEDQQNETLSNDAMPQKPSLLETIAQDLGVSQEAIKEIVKRLGAMI